MSDIMERLRGLADLFEAGDAPRHLVLHMRAGAAEIERKKAEIASLLKLLADARTESMKLRAALEDIAYGNPLHNEADLMRIARAALEGGRT